MAVIKALSGAIARCPIIGPAYINNTTNLQVVFDNLNDDYGYELLMKDGDINWKKVVKSSGTTTGIKLTYTMPSKYTSVADGTTQVSLTTSNEFYLMVI